LINVRGKHRKIFETLEKDLVDIKALIFTRYALFASKEVN